MSTIDRATAARPSGTSSRLAVDGGTPVRSHRAWPTWPVPALRAEANLREVLHSGRWAISSPRGSELFERRFARQFAEYVGTRRCVPVDHGSSALVVALEALNLEYGDLVFVPALTWVASASAALRAGLVPVLVDVAPDSGCVAPEHLDADVPARAVVAVHWANAMADVPALVAHGAERGMVVIEDAAQAHGAQWLGRPAGSIGLMGCFSFQHGKVLAAGEGGAVVCDDAVLAQRLEELRADSRRYANDADAPGMLDLEETASIQGANFSMSEFSAALLCAQLELLEEQNERRSTSFALLAERLADVPGVRLLTPDARQTRMSLYEPTLVFDGFAPGVTNEDVAAALSSELGRSFYVTDTPLHRSPLLCPGTKPALRPLVERFDELNRDRIFPGTDHLATHTVQTHHSAFLGSEQDMADIAEAVAKVSRCLGDPGRA